MLCELPVQLTNSHKIKCRPLEAPLCVTPQREITTLLPWPEDVSWKRRDESRGVALRKFGKSDRQNRSSLLKGLS
jgi:hypothetical protein